MATVNPDYCDPNRLDEAALAFKDKLDKLPDLKRAATAVLHVLDAMLATIKECGGEGCPSGPLYATMMTTGMSLTQYEDLLNVLIKTGVIKRQGHVLYWTAKEAPQPVSKLAAYQTTYKQG